MIAGKNFGCGSSREHPSVGLSCAGISAIFRFQPLPEKLKQILEMKGLVNYLKSV